MSGTTKVTVLNSSGATVYTLAYSEEGFWWDNAFMTWDELNARLSRPSAP